MTANNEGSDTTSHLRQSPSTSCDGNMSRPTALAVVMPTYNQRDYISQSIMSVLNQTDGDWILIISDNCSTDDTIETITPFLEDHRIVLVRNNHNIGVMGNWARCFERVPREVDHVVLLPSDDVMLPNHLRTVRASFDRFPNATLVHSDASIINSNGDVLRGHYIRDPELRAGPSTNLGFLLRRNYILCPGTALNRRLIASGLSTLFDEKYPLTHDWRAWVELMTTGHEFVFTGEASMCFRVHGAQVTQPSRFGATHQEVLNFLGEIEPRFPEHRALIRVGMRRQAMNVATNRALSFKPKEAWAAFKVAVTTGQGDFLTKDLVGAVKFSALGQSIARWAPSRRQA